MRFMILVLLLATSGCASSGRSNTRESQRAAITRVIEIDNQAGAVRNEATRVKPAHEVVGNYANTLRSIDLSDTPQDFRSAWIAHIEAWEAMIPYLRRHHRLRGEMHDVFDRLLSDNNPTAAEFQALHDAMWASWTPVQDALTRYGIE